MLYINCSPIRLISALEKCFLPPWTSYPKNDVYRVRAFGDFINLSRLALAVDFLLFVSSNTHSW